jgi:CheY-like chemotaxis protein
MTNEPTMLVAEDNENDILLLRQAFIKANITVPVVFVRDGQEAIEYLKDDRMAKSFPQLLLLDLQMPKFNGFEVLAWIREQPDLKRLVVILFTTSDLNEDINRAYDLGANSYLNKPIGVNALADLMEGIQKYWLKTNRGPDCKPQK